MRKIIFTLLSIFIFFPFHIQDVNAYSRKVLSDGISDDDFDRAKDYIRKADKYRGENYKDFVLYSTITRFVDDKEVDLVDIITYVRFYKKRNEKGFSRDSLIQITSGNSVGTFILQKENSMWFYRKGTENAIRISPTQQLLGGVAYSDVASTNFSELYDPVKLEEVVLEDVNVYKISLKKVEIGVAYDAINLYLSKNDYKPLKSEFFTSSGRLLKVMYFKSFGLLVSEIIAKELVIVDETNENKSTVIKINKMKRTLLSGRMFTQEGVKRF